MNQMTRKKKKDLLILIFIYNIFPVYTHTNKLQMYLMLYLLHLFGIHLFFTEAHSSLSSPLDPC